MEKTLEFRGLKRKTILGYLLSIANLTHDDVMEKENGSILLQATNWSVLLSKEETYQAGPVMSFPRLYITFAGQEETVEQVVSKLRTKTIRLGG